MRDLNQLLSQLRGFVTKAEKGNIEVSSVNIGWHVEHSLLVMVRMIDSLCRSDPKGYRWNFNLLRTIVFTRKRFPRGKGKAPEEVRPKQLEPIDYEVLFQKAETAIERLNAADPNQHFEHAMFGKLNRKNTSTLLYIHTRHHLMIIEDIVRK